MNNKAILLISFIAVIVFLISINLTLTFVGYWNFLFGHRGASGPRANWNTTQIAPKAVIWRKQVCVNKSVVHYMYVYSCFCFSQDQFFKFQRDTKALWRILSENTEL